MVKSFYHVEVINEETYEVLFSGYRRELKNARDLAKKLRDKLESEEYDYSCHDSHSYLVEWSEWWMYEKDCDLITVNIHLDDCALQDRDGKLIYYGGCKPLIFDDESEVAIWMADEENNSKIKVA